MRLARRGPSAQQPAPPRKPFPAGAYAFIWLVAAVAVVAFALALRTRPPLSGHSLQLFLILTALTLVTYRYPVELAPKIKLIVVEVSVFAALLLLPLSLAAASTMLGVGLGELLKRSTPRQLLFNTAMATVAALAAGAVLQWLSPHPFVERTDIGPAVVVALAAVVHFAMNTLIVGTMASLHMRRNAFAGWWSSRRPMLPQQATLYLLAVFAALIGYEQPWALLLVAAPAFVVYRSLRDGVALRTQTRDAVEQLADIVDMRDRYTFEHSRRVAELARATALRMGVGAAVAQEIAMAARVHDVGKIGIRSTTLFKETAMEEEEWVEMRSHAEIGAQLISRFPDFAAGRAIVLHHHERWDGKGYPAGLAGEKIPLGARVIAVADTFDAMTSNRAYRHALPIEVVFAELQRGRGTQFDPRALDVFLEILRERPEYISRTESVATPAAEGVYLPRAAGAVGR